MEKVRLCDVCDFQGGSQPPKNEWSFEQKDGYIRMLQIRDFTQTRNVEKEYIKLTSSTKTCVTEDILIARYGASIGKILTGLSGAYNVAIMKTIPNEGILNKSYLKYYLLSNYFQNGINSVGARAAQAGFNKEDLSKLYIPVVSLVQQKLIVDKLNKLTTFIGKRKTQLEKLDELVKARFVEMFGTLNANEKGFDVIDIEKLCTLIKDGTHQTPTYTEDKQNGFKFLSSKDVMTQKICWEDIKYIPAELHEKLYAAIQPKRNDILMSKNGVNYGVAAVNDTDEVFDIYVSLALLRPKTDRVNPVYLRCAINNPDTKRQFDSSIKGIGVPNLHLGEIKKTKVLLPPISKQNEFTDFVEQVDKSKFEIKQSLEKLELLKKALMQKYFG